MQFTHVIMSISNKQHPKICLVILFSNYNLNGIVPIFILITTMMNYNVHCILIYQHEIVF